MESRYHFIMSLFLALPFYADFVAFTLIMVSGWLIDSDHEVDYYILSGRLECNPLKLGDVLGRHLYLANKGKMFVPLHSIEWVLILFLLPIHKVVLLAFLAHLLMDYVCNRLKGQYMSLFWRWHKKWKMELRD